MKKLMFALVAAGAAAVMADGIESQNVVGYDTLQPDAQYIMMGMPFCKAGGGTNTVDSIVGDFSSGDQIQVAYMDKGLIEFTIYSYLTEDDDLVENGDGWYDGAENYVGNTLKLPQGAAVWFKSKSGTPVDLTRAGEVTTNEVRHNGFANTYNMICGAFPVPFNPNDSRITWNVQSGDQIQVAYVDKGLIEFTIYSYLTEDDDLVEEGDGWYDGAENLIKTPIAAAGQGFWLKLKNPASSSMVETSPIAKN